MMCLALLAALPMSAQIKLNEVFINPAQDATNPLYQSLVDCANTNYGYEWVEIYNSSRCDTIDIGCYVLASNTGSANYGSFTFPANTILAPLQHLVVGGPNVSGVDIDLSTFCGTGSLCTSGNWSLDNGYGWIGIYQADGTVSDAVYWTLNTGEPNARTTQAAYDGVPCKPTITTCTFPNAFKAADQMSAGLEISYAGRFPGPGLSIYRTLDGTGNWQTGGAATVGACNGPCAPGTDLTLVFDSVAPERCRAMDGFLSVVPSGGMGPYQFIWNNDDRDPEIEKLKEGLYAITVTDYEGCTFLLDTLLPNIGEPVVVNIDPSQATIFNGDQIQLDVVSANILVTALWGPITGLSCGTCFNPRADPRVTTTYTLQVEDLDGCKGDTTITITVIKDENSAFVPTAFSPDGDGKNDILYLRSPRVKNLEFRIFDRWGQEMFYTTDQGIGWSGTDKNDKPANVGVYVYYAVLIFENGKTRTIKGNITLLK
ncbi:hypothetical protein BH09BAC1_BH09BAC1_09910 [soil metagenome]